VEDLSSKKFANCLDWYLVVLEEFSMHLQIPALVLDPAEGERLIPAITPLEVIFAPLQLLTWIFLACTGDSVHTECPVEWRMLTKLRSSCKWMLGGQVTIPIRRMKLIGLFQKLTFCASGSV